MLGIISMAGNALRSFGSIHPAIKWGVVAIVGLLAVEFIGKEAVGVWVAMHGANGGVAIDTTEENWCANEAEYRLRYGGIGPMRDYVPDCTINWAQTHAKMREQHEQYMKKSVCEGTDKELRHDLGAVYGCPVN